MDIQGIIVAILQLLASLSILVGLHELGHLLAAKYFGIKVEKFSIGFPPKIFGIKFGETEYSIGAVPLGGFVKIAGMMDESMDKDQLKGEVQDWEFRSKPAWQRLIVMLGGIIFNVILGVLIMISISFAIGERYVTLEEANKYGIEASELGEKLGFQTGDKIINVNGEQVKSFNDVLNPDYILSEGSYYTVERNGQEIKIPITGEFLKEYSGGKSKGFIGLRVDKYPTLVEKISPTSNAAKGGLKAGDKFLKADGTEVATFAVLKNYLNTHAGQQVNFVVERDGSTKELTIQVGKDSTLGFVPKFDIPMHTRPYGFFEAIQVGAGRAFGVLAVQAKAYNQMAQGNIDATKSLSGPLGMAMMFGTDFDALHFWSLTAMLSMILALMNLLPIPVLDGGHVVFLLYEMVTGRAPSDKFMEWALKIGFVLIAGLMIFIFAVDSMKIYDAIKEWFAGK